MRRAAWALVAAAMLATVEPLALKSRGGLTKSKKKKKLKKAPVAPPPQVPLSWSLSPEEHMAAVSNAVESAADGIQAALTKDDFFSRTNFLDKRGVSCKRMAEEAEAPRRHARALAVDALRSRKTIAYDKEGVRSTQILGGNAYDEAPRLTEYVVSSCRACRASPGK